MEEQVEVEGHVLARVVHAHVEVQLLLSQDEPVRHPELAVPHAARILAVSEGEDGLHVTGVEAVGALLQLPAGDAGEAVLQREKNEMLNTFVANCGLAMILH